MDDGDDEDGLRTEQSYKEGIARLLEDCNTYQKITKIYGVPKQNNFVINEGFNGGKELVIPLFDKKDTTLNMISCKIVIQFYPESIQSAKKFYGYRVEKGVEKSKNMKLIPLPIPSGNKNN